MILTYKIKHNKNYSEELKKAKQIANFAVKTKTLSSKNVKQFGLKSIISNQILRKYSRNKKLKSIKSVNLTIPNQGIKFKNNIIYIPCLKLELEFNKQFEKINQIEFNKEYALISVTVKEEKQIVPKVSIGIDLNTTGYCAVVGIPKTGKVFKLGKKANHIHNKYKNIRKNLQKKRKFKKVKKLKNRESRIIKNLNHKISRQIINIAKEVSGEIKLENLKGIRNNKKQSKNFKYSLNSWSYFQLRTFIEYKAKLAGIPVIFINPYNTSKTCSKCGSIGTRNKKEFKCQCGHVENADVNASFNIGILSNSIQSISQFIQDRDCMKRNTDILKKATL